MSFVGFAPYDNPRFALIVIFDGGRGRGGAWGGTVAAPVWRRIAWQALRYMRVPPSGARVLRVARLPADGRAGARGAKRPPDGGGAQRLFGRCCALSGVTAVRERSMPFGELTRAVPGARVAGDFSVRVAGVAYDSRRIRAGDVFVAVPGFEADGHDFVEAALEAGAAALVVERRLEGVSPEIPQFVASSCREALSRIGDAFYGHPSGELALIGVTGTNGKTTTAFLIDAILRSSGRDGGLMGTIHYRVGGDVFEEPRTTPEGPDLQRYLRRMADAGASHAVMEVSSHGLSLGRLLGCEFQTAVFTNLTQDHLDFHGDMESYFQAKRKLFREFAPAHSILNADDEYGRRIAAEARGRVVWTYAVDGAAEVRAESVSSAPSGMRFRMATPGGRVPVETSLIGRHNLSNILAASAACLSCGLTLDEVAAGVRSLGNIPGRFERIDAGQPFLVVVDYAHTEDALARLLEFARPVAQGRILTLMGCGGDRDREKRPRMAAAALRASDYVVMTSDNPRTEDPEAILREMESGAALVPGSAGGWRTIVDRREAIQAVLAEARAGDAVIIAGKGHETYQVLGKERVPFDDRAEARRALRLAGYAG